MRKYIPVLKADIVPLQSTADIEIGLISNDLIKYAPHKMVSEQQYNSLSNTCDSWYVVHFEGVDILVDYASEPNQIIPLFYVTMRPGRQKKYGMN